MKLDDPRTLAAAPAAALPPQTISEEVLLEKYAKGTESSAEDIHARVSLALAAVEQPAEVVHPAEEDRALAQLLAVERPGNEQAHREGAVRGALGEVHVAVAEEHRGGGCRRQRQLAGDTLTPGGLDHLPGRARAEPAFLGEKVCVHVVSSAFGRPSLRRTRWAEGRAPDNLPPRKGARAAKGTRLESVRGASLRGFKSCLL